MKPIGEFLPLFCSFLDNSTISRIGIYTRQKSRLNLHRQCMKSIFLPFKDMKTTDFSFAMRLLAHSQETFLNYPFSKRVPDHFEWQIRMQIMKQYKCVYLIYEISLLNDVLVKTDHPQPVKRKRSKIRLWYQIIVSSSNGSQRGFPIDFIDVDSSFIVGELRDGIQNKHQAYLGTYDAFDIRIYSNRGRFHQNSEDFLSVDSPIGLLGTSSSDAVVVVASRIQEHVTEHDSSVKPRLVVPHSTSSAFRGNDMDADLDPSSSASSPFSMKKDVIQVDGIDMATEHLKRSDLLA
jgi:hypothetical protein